MTTQHEESSTLKRPRNTKSRDQLNRLFSNDFFKMAALIANPETKAESGFNLHKSNYLEALSQEKSDVLVVIQAETMSIDEKKSLAKIILDKWTNLFGQIDPALKQLFLKYSRVISSTALRYRAHNGVTKNDVSFSPKELQMIMSIAENLLCQAWISNQPQTKMAMSATSFHAAFLTILKERSSCPYIVHTSSMVNEIRRARLFWSHRLKIKSWQASIGADPSVRYFHAACENVHEQALDFLYWLKLDEQRRPIDGAIIYATPRTLAPQGFFIGEDLYNLKLLQDRAAILDVWQHRFISAAIELVRASMA